ncbi:MAG: methyltransferase domain-containing protein [Candidatus ainarchaeum sp.]|nr:methyltransferase domain-containing protein [Candidatus ainarchaeum sp.]
MKNTTNVNPEDLNYHHHSARRYDAEIVDSIPFYNEIHKIIQNFISENFEVNKNYSILDLGVGTGFTSKIFLDLLPNSELDAVDFSRNMLKGAKKRLGKERVNFIFGDYSKLKFGKKYDIVVSVLGMHHQTNFGKKLVFKKIYSMLKPKGIFIFGDLVTHKNKHKAALNHALHLGSLVGHATNQKMLQEWAYHHLVLNDLAPVEDQLSWLKSFGFKAKLAFLKMNTALIICRK